MQQTQQCGIWAVDRYHYSKIYVQAMNSTNTLGQSLSKFPYLAEPIQEAGFARWTNTNFYRTSYNDMHVSVRPPINNRLP